jgi:hypothetical protein
MNLLDYLSVACCTQVDAFFKVESFGGVERARVYRQIAQAQWLAAYRDVTDTYDFVGLTGITDDAAAQAVFAMMESPNSGGVATLGEWCRCLKDAEIAAGTAVGEALAEAQQATNSEANDAAVVVTSAALSGEGDESVADSEAATSFGLTLAKAASQELKDLVSCFQPLAVESPEADALRAEYFASADPNGNGLCSLAEIETFVLKTLVTTFPKTGKGKEMQQRGKDVFAAFRPCYIRAFKDAADYKVDMGAVIAGTKKATGDDFVSFEEFRLFNAYLCVYAAMFDAFAAIDGGGRGRTKTDDRRIDVAELQAGFKGLGSYGFVAFQGLETKKDAKALFLRIDDNGGGVVLLEEWCEYIKFMEVSANTALGKLLAADEAGSIGKEWKKPAGKKAFTLAKKGGDRKTLTDAEKKKKVAEERSRAAASRRADAEARRKKAVVAREAADADEGRQKLRRSKVKKDLARSASAPRDSESAISRAPQASPAGQNAAVAVRIPEEEAFRAAGSKRQIVSVDRAGMRASATRQQRLAEGSARSTVPLRPEVGIGGGSGQLSTWSEERGALLSTPLLPPPPQRSRSQTLRLEAEVAAHLAREGRAGRQHLLEVLQLMEVGAVAHRAPSRVSMPSWLGAGPAVLRGSSIARRRGREAAAAKIRALSSEVESLKAQLVLTSSAAESTGAVVAGSPALPPAAQSAADKVTPPPPHPKGCAAEASAGAEAWAAEAASALRRDAALSAHRAAAPGGSSEATPPALLAAGVENAAEGRDAEAWAAAAADALRREATAEAPAEPASSLLSAPLHQGGHEKGELAVDAWLHAPLTNAAAVHLELKGRAGRAQLLEVLQLLDWDEATLPKLEGARDSGLV